ncbi:MAG: hypothetical protein O0X93_08400 [Methanocorpusculum sp.]|nr:hypothetical protein [Methanocorpusculum sp.]MDE2523158.1 hypothetical protein [Methanocorpusculum sp.]MDE2525022.1 hypothetical protein [Methanocorpusculum sp.]
MSITWSAILLTVPVAVVAAVVMLSTGFFVDVVFPTVTGLAVVVAVFSTVTAGATGAGAIIAFAAAVAVAATLPGVLVMAVVVSAAVLVIAAAACVVVDRMFRENEDTVDAAAVLMFCTAPATFLDTAVIPCVAEDCTFRTTFDTFCEIADTACVAVD